MAHNSTLPFTAKVIRLYLRSGLRGQTRLTHLLAHKLKSLQEVPIKIPNQAPIYIDLRLGNAHVVLKNSPYTGFFRELDEVNVMQSFVRRGDVIFDIGANIGLHAVLLSNLIGLEGRLCVFEPNPELLPALTQTISELSNATLHPIALSNQNAESVLYVPPDDSCASLANWTSDRNVGESHTVSCTQRRMDELIAEGTIPQPDFIKCDVEGAELFVFQGGRHTLNRADAPIILFEANNYPAQGFGLKVSDAQDFLESLELSHYHFFEVHQRELLRVQTVNPGYSNILALPEAKICHWPELASVDRIELNQEVKFSE